VVSNFSQRTLQIPTNLPPDLATTAAITQMSSEISNVTVRIQALEDAISSSPDKAIALPLMRKDLDNMQREQADDRANTQAEFDRLSDFNKWFFGLIATMAVSIVGLAISNAFKKS
jgi:hypothetical protein